ncbi:30S ribosome-binding factor RbfA [Candidatus Latescibacterota bacterium]
MNKYKRSDRISNLIHHAVSKIIENEIQDTRLGMVTVTGVDIGRDLRNASVYISVLDDESDIELTLSILNKAAGFFRSRIGQEVILRHVPTVQFYYDNSAKNGIHIEKLFEEINKET